MIFQIVISRGVLVVLCTAEDYYYYPYNVTRSTLSGIAAYRSALTLDWLAAEDNRQRELAAAFETEAAPPSRILTTECIAYARPSTGKVARLMLELLKNLEGDHGKLVPELIQVLVRAKLLVETSILEAEPDLEALVKTPGVMMGEPHVTFPRILAMLWLTVSDPTTTRKFGWCPINKVNKYIAVSKSSHIAKHMRALEPIVARARFIMEEFIQIVTPLNMYQKRASDVTDRDKSDEVTATKPTRSRHLKTVRRPLRYFTTLERLPRVEPLPSVRTPDPDNMDPIPRIIDGSQVIVANSAAHIGLYKILLTVLYCL